MALSDPVYVLIDGAEDNNDDFFSGAAYVYRRAGASWTQEAFVKPSNTPQTGQFGFSVDVSGDSLVVGAPVESSNATGINGNQLDISANASGAVYVFQ